MTDATHIAGRVYSQNVYNVQGDFS